MNDELCENLLTSKLFNKCYFKSGRLVVLCAVSSRTLARSVPVDHSHVCQQPIT